MSDELGPGMLVTLGECMGTFVAAERGPLAEAATFRRMVAGAEANVAVGVARLGVPAAFIGRVGADGLGTSVRRRLAGEGVDVRHLWTDPEGATGVMIRELRDVGPSELMYWRSGSAGSRIGESDVEAAGATIDAASWLHLTGITPALSESASNAVEAALTRAHMSVALNAAVQRGQASHTTVSLDVNLRRRLWSEREARDVLGPLVARCDVVFGGKDELAVVAGLADTLEAGAEASPDAVSTAVLEMGPQVAVVKLGAAGALERRRTAAGTSRIAAEALPLDRVVDPVGAGDAFCAGYIATTLSGGDPAAALAAANACGAAVAGTFGDQIGLPTREELERLLGGGSADVLR